MFSIYGIFAVAVIAQYLIRACLLIRGAPLDRGVEPTPSHEAE